MHGRAVVDDRGQLALMDAAVFFAAAILISSAIVRYVDMGSGRDLGAASGGAIDAGSALEVLLRASIGRDLTLHLDGDVIVPRHEPIASCLAAELRAVQEGSDLGAFAELNGVIYEAMRATAGHGLDPFLSLVDAAGEGSGPVLAIPGPPPVSSSAYSASVEMPGLERGTFLVVLVLCPALLA